jgi:hypothetical protein
LFRDFRSVCTPPHSLAQQPEEVSPNPRNFRHLGFKPKPPKFVQIGSLFKTAFAATPILFLAMRGHWSFRIFPDIAFQVNSPRPAGKSQIILRRTTDMHPGICSTKSACVTEPTPSGSSQRYKADVRHFPLNCL